MGLIRTFVLAVCSAWLFSQPAAAAKRVALVIGNSAYQHVNQLANPANDAEAMSATLRNAGFDVVDLKRDLKANEMRRALRDFSDQVRDADVAIVYFAGHGIEIDGINYVIPVDAVLERDIDAFDEAIPLDRILTVIEPARQLRLVILDACRDNPFNRTMKRSGEARSIGRGLAEVEPNNPNTLIAFAAKAGSIASDGDSSNSPFTAALVKYLPRPGLDLRKAFGFTRDEVLKATNNRQEPFIYGSLGGDDVALVPAVAAPPAAVSPADPNAAVRQDYELAERIGTTPVWNSFISHYPSGFYSDLARAQRDKLAAQAAAASAEQRRQADPANVAAPTRESEVTAISAGRNQAADETKGPVAADSKGGDQAPVGPIAALTPPQQTGDIPAKPDKPVADDVSRLLQTELRRVGCNTGAVDGNWNAAAQRSLLLFNKHAGTTLDVKVASLDALDVVRGRTARVCPLVCEHGYRADGETCRKITCKAGFELDDDNNCERVAPVRREQPVAKFAPPTARGLAPGLAPGEPPHGTLAYGTRVVVQSSACGKGQVLELIGGNDRQNIPRQRRCIAAN